MTTEKFVLAIDQGTTSTRAIIFNHAGEIVSVGQKEFTQIFPNPGWVEHNPIEIWDTTRTVVAEALQKAEINRHNLAAVGITNQRETTVVWDKNTGEPVYNAIVWQDMRTSDIVKELEGDEGPDRFRQICGLGLSPYFSGSKIKWILDNVEGARERAEAGDLLLRQHRLLGPVEPDGRRQRRRALHRRHQRLAHHAHGHPYPLLA